MARRKKSNLGADRLPLLWEAYHILDHLHFLAWLRGKEERRWSPETPPAAYSEAQRALLAAIEAELTPEELEFVRWLAAGDVPGPIVSHLPSLPSGQDKSRIIQERAGYHRADMGWIPIGAEQQADAVTSLDAHRKTKS